MCEEKKKQKNQGKYHLYSTVQKFGVGLIIYLIKYTEQSNIVKYYEMKIIFCYI